MITTVNAIIEIPKGSFYKYEVSKEDGTLVLDRVLSIPIVENYGYVPNTLSEDGDPIDVYVVSQYPIAPLTRVKLEVHAVIKCVDSGFNDEKLICTLVGDKPEVLRYYHILDYLRMYKPGKITGLETGDAKEAKRFLNEAIERYKKS